MGMTTYTMARLEVSPEAYDEIVMKLRKAQYHHAFGADGSIDMQGLAIVRELGLPRWKCHKKVRAAKIVNVLNALDGMLLALDGIAEPVRVSFTWMDKHEPVVGGYYVVYEDGYTSFSPAKAFEDGYTPLPL